MDSHFWHILEELSFSAYLLQYKIIVWFFASRQGDVILTTPFIFLLAVSVFVFSYFLSIPYYILFERPIKNILDLILFPKQSIFKRRKDVEEDSEEETETEAEEEV